MSNSSQSAAHGPKVVVLGAGLAGLAASQRLRTQGFSVEVLEREAYIGGHAASRRRDGFTFDFGPHVSFTRRPEIRDLLARAVAGRSHEHQAYLLNLWRGHWIPHPAQCHLFGLPAELLEQCILEVAELLRSAPGDPANYAEWCRGSLGRTFSEQFTFAYTRKYWTVEAEELTVDWVSNRMHRPTLQEVVRGALRDTPAAEHYITSFRYPAEGGFGSYAYGLLGNEPVRLGARAVSLDLPRRRIGLEDGQEVHYDFLVNSLPLPELVRLATDVPSAVREAAERLSCTSLVLVNVGLGRAEGFPEAHWMYFYDEDVCFARANLPHRLAHSNAPDGCGSIQVEVYHSKSRPLPWTDVASRAMDDLVRTGLVRKSDDVRFLEETRLEYANIVFDASRRTAVAAITKFLESRGVVSCGRYGEWAYLWTDDVLLSGRRAADRIVERTGSISIAAGTRACS